MNVCYACLCHRDLIAKERLSKSSPRVEVRSKRPRAPGRKGWALDVRAFLGFLLRVEEGEELLFGFRGRLGFRDLRVRGLGPRAERRVPSSREAVLLVSGLLGDGVEACG